MSELPAEVLAALREFRCCELALGPVSPLSGAGGSNDCSTECARDVRLKSTPAGAMVRIEYVYIDRPNLTESGEGSEIPVQLGAASDIDLCSAFENAPIGMAVLTPLGVITACNAALGDLLGRPPGELIGGTLFDITHPDDLDGAKYNCALMKGGGSRILRHECRFLSATAPSCWY